MAKYKLGAIIKDVPEGSEKWYKMAGWKKIETKKPKNTGVKDDKTNPQKTTTA